VRRAHRPRPRRASLTGCGGLDAKHTAAAIAPRKGQAAAATTAANMATTQRNPYDEALTTILFWVVVGELAVLVPVVTAFLVTVQRHYRRWLVLRSRGLWYTRCLLWGPYVQFAICFALAFTCMYIQWDHRSPALAALTVCEEAVLFFLTGVVIARQLVLATIFQTLPWHRPNSLKTVTINRSVFVAIPIVLTFVWLCVSGLATQLLVFGVISEDAGSTLIYVATTAVVLLYAFPAFANRRIPMMLFCDYWANVATFILVFLVILGVGCASSIYLVPNSYWLAYRIARTCGIVAVVGLYPVINFFRPVWAVWRDDIVYLQGHENAIRDVRMHLDGTDAPTIVGPAALLGSSSQAAIAPATETIVMGRITVALDAQSPDHMAVLRNAESFDDA